MAAKEELNCVSCESTFDPGPNGGFCPDCDTPHPDYEMPTTDDGDVGASESGEKAAEADEQPVEADEQSTETNEQMSELDGDESRPEIDAEPETEDPATAEESTGNQCSSCGTAVDPTASFCSSCGTELEVESEIETESDELTECPNCSNSVDDESFCPNCGTDLDAIRAGEGEIGDDDAEAVEEADDGDEAEESEAGEEANGEDDSDDAEDSEDADDDDAEEDGDDTEEAEDGDEAEEDDADETLDAVTLVIAGESYRLEDGDTFGRQDNVWLDDLVTASGGREEASYISGEHLEFEIAEDGVYLTDLSTNGTSHNGEPLDGGRTKLEDSDTLELAGRAEVTVEL